jgi:cardiolipin synthase
MQIPWLLLVELLYLVALVFTIVRIIYDTEVPAKTMGYLLVVVVVPILGMVIYYSIGTNLRKRKLYRNKLIGDGPLRRQLIHDARENTEAAMSDAPFLQSCSKLIRLMQDQNLSPLTTNNEVDILINGEHKFPKVLEAMQAAKDHIHVEYYRFEDDEVGQEFAEVLLAKAREGVTIRLIYDDFGSRNIRRRMTNELCEAGVQVAPYYAIKFMAVASRINYRNHRKIIVVDGYLGFVGGINVSTDYVNDKKYKSEKEPLFWRDTHLMLYGSAVTHLQYIFLNDWNFCASEKVSLQEARDRYFPLPAKRKGGGKAVQITASGPDSDAPAILYSILQAIDLAQDRILITTPYFIPGQSLMDNLCIASGAGIDVQLLVPLKGDSVVVNRAAASYYEQLLKSGVRIFRYRKGFLHAKTMVVDEAISIVGTANLDIRSFDLNFEVNAIIYDKDIAVKLADTFAIDLQDTTELTLEDWEDRSKLTRFLENLARMLSPLL